MNISILLRHSGIWVSDINYEGYNLNFEIFKCTKKLICSIVYYMVRVYILMSYKFDILYSTVFGFQFYSNSSWAYL